MAATAVGDGMAPPTMASRIASNAGAVNETLIELLYSEPNSRYQRSVRKPGVRATTMNYGTRDLVSALLAMGYAAILLVLGELYITSRSTELSAIFLKHSVLVSQALHAIAAD
jgi:hypothetical protein